MTKKNQQIYYAVIEFTKKLALKKALDNNWLNGKIEELYGQKKMEVEPEVDEKWVEHVSKMEEGGFTMVLSKKAKKRGKYDVVIPQDMNVELKTKRPRSEATNFYNFQVKDGPSLKRMKVDDEKSKDDK